MPSIKKREIKGQKKGEDYENSGTVILKSINIDRDTTFLDYIRGGLRFNFIVAVDFTKSNGMPNDPNSLHYLDRDRLENPYTMAIRSVGDIVQDYDYDRRFLGLGFGGTVNGRVSHCFPLNGKSRDPYCQGIDGVINAYYDSLAHVPPADPTCYAPVIDYVRAMAERMQNGQDYLVLLIITDGGISGIIFFLKFRYCEKATKFEKKISPFFKVKYLVKSPDKLGDFFKFLFSFSQHLIFKGSYSIFLDTVFPHIYSFLNFEIVENSNSSRNISIFYLIRN